MVQAVSVFPSYASATCVGFSSPLPLSATGSKSRAAAIAYGPLCCPGLEDEVPVRDALELPPPACPLRVNTEIRPTTSAITTMTTSTPVTMSRRCGLWLAFVLSGTTIGVELSFTGITTTAVGSMSEVWTGDSRCIG